MNSENISALVAQLQSVGFKNLEQILVKKISFKPNHFILTSHSDKGKDKLNFEIYFERLPKNNSYLLQYYDAVLKQELAIENTVINGVDITVLEKAMYAIDWKYAFDFAINSEVKEMDKASWEKAERVEMVITHLEELEASDEGKMVAVGLKLKYWHGTQYEEVFGNIVTIKSKNEVSQRFYVAEGQPCISVDEACRFLQNKWMEKNIQQKRKMLISDNDEASYTDDKNSGSGSLLSKRRIIKGAKGKRNKSAQG